MSREVMQQALEALELHGKEYPHMVENYCLKAITALREALAQPAQRQPLTDAEIWQMVKVCVIGRDLHADKFARVIEAAHGIKQ